MAAPTSVPPREGAAADDSDAIDLSYARDVGRFFLRTARRRRLFTGAVLLLGAAATAGAAYSAPRSYTTEAKILAQRQVPIPVLSNAQHNDPVDPEPATRAARETRAASEAILRRDNLASIIEETKLVDRWEQGRSPIQTAFDAVRRAIHPSASSQDRQRALVGVLEKKIGVRVDDAIITLSVSWHDPEIGQQILSCILRNYLKDRGDVETAATAATITILENEAARQRDAIDAALAAAEDVQNSALKAEAIARRRSNGDGRAVWAGGLGDPVLALDLADKRRAIQAAEDAQQHRLSELHTELDKLRVAYTTGHPSVTAMEERIRNASAQPPELADLKREERALLARTKGVGPSGEPLIGALEQPKVAATRMRLVTAVNKYEELVGHLDAARLDLHAAQATFKHRYLISEPPELPKKTDRPILLIVMLVGALLTVGIGLSAAGLRELSRGRFVDPPQVRRKLPIPLLAEVEEP